MESNTDNASNSNETLGKRCFIYWTAQFKSTNKILYVIPWNYNNYFKWVDKAEFKIALELTENSSI